MGNAERMISQNGEDLTDAYSSQAACEPEVESRYSLPQALEEAYTPSGQVTCEHGRGLGGTCEECTDSRRTGKIYIVQSGEFILAATSDREQAEEAARRTLIYLDHDGFEFRTDPGSKTWACPRDYLHYKSLQTGRWNKSPCTITTAELS